MYSWGNQYGIDKTRRTERENGELSGEFMEWNKVERAIKTETDTRTMWKGLGKLAWLMSDINRNIPNTWRWASRNSCQYRHNVGQKSYKHPPPLPASDDPLLLTVTSAPALQKDLILFPHLKVPCSFFSFFFFFFGGLVFWAQSTTKDYIRADFGSVNWIVN